MQINKLIDTIAQNLLGRSLLMIFDRDGTLVPYNPDPQQAIMPSIVRDLFQELSSTKKVQIGILSARDIKQLRSDFDQDNLILAGNYGMEIVFPDKRTFVHPVAKTSRLSLLETKEKLQEKLPPEAQTILEDHELVLCLHWHMTPSNLRQTVHSIVKKIATETPGLIFKTLPTSYEIWPPLEWTKANGLEQMHSFLQIDFNKYLVFYAGDSEPDESAFKWINDRQGISLRIGKTDNTAAKFQINSTAEIPDFLKQLYLLLAAIGGKS